MAVGSQKDLDAGSLRGQMPYRKAVLVVTAVAFPECRALLVGTAGSAAVTMADGAVVAAMPLQAGYNPLRCTLLTLGTAANVFALY